MDIKIKNYENNVIFYVNGISLSSTITGGGKISSVLFNTLNEYIEINNFDDYVNKILKNYKLKNNTPVFVTLVDVNNIKIENNEDYLVAVTLGISEPASFDSELKPGTINVLVILKRKPSGNAMVDLFRVVTEAKSMASFSLGLKFGDIPSPGTVSDEICVVFTGGENIRFCGFGTETGNKIIETVYKMVYNTGKEYLKNKK